MAAIDDIISSIQTLSELGMENMDNPHSILAKVLSIDSGNSCTVQPLDTNRTIISNVFLTGDDNSEPIYVPAPGSTVTVTLFGTNSGYVAQHGSLQSAAIAGTHYGGVVIVENLTTKINNLENTVNDISDWIKDFVNKYNNHDHNVPGVQTGTGSVISAPTTQQETKTSEDALTLTTIDDLENKVVQHGSGSTASGPYFIRYKEAESNYNSALHTYQSDAAKYDDINNQVQTLETSGGSSAAIATLNAQKANMKKILENDKKIVADKLKIFNEVKASNPTN